MPIGADEIFYNAFISYSHAMDGALAPILQQSLHNYAKPFYKIRAVRVFRDQTSLSATPELWSSIAKSLDKSDYFILLASPAAAASEWVRKEIDYWLAKKSPQKLIICLTEGEADWDAGIGDFSWPYSTAIPQNLSGAFHEEPRYVDLRKAKSEDSLNLRNPVFIDAVADIAATLRNIPKEDIYGEEVRQHKMTRRWEWAAGIALTMIAVIAVLYAYQANQQRDLARAREITAHGVLKLDTEPQLAFRLAEAALSITPIIESERLLWDAYANPLKFTLAGHSGAINAIAYSGNGAMIASAANDQEIRLWDANVGTAIARLTGHTLKVIKIAFSNDDKLIVSASADGTVRLWDVKAQKQVAMVDVSVHGTIVLARFEPDGKILIISEDGTAYSWDGKTSEKPFLSISPGLANASASNDGKYIAAAKKTNFGVVWYRQSRQFFKKLEGHSQDICSLAFSPDSRWIATASLDGTALVWDLEKSERAPIALKGHDKAVEQASFSADGQEIITASADGTARIWEVRSGREVLSREAGEPISLAALSPKSQDFAVALQNQSKILIWNRLPKLSIFEVALDSSIVSLAYTPDGNKLLAGGLDGILYEWEPGGASATITQLRGNPEKIEHLRYFSHCGKRLLTSSTDGAVYKWKADVYEPVHIFKATSSQHYRSASFSPGGTVVVTSSDAESPVIWDVEAEIPLATLEAEKRLLTSIAMTALGDRIAAVDEDNALRLWNGVSGGLVKVMGHVNGQVTALLVSPDNRLVAVSTSKGGVNLYSAVDGRAVFDLSDALSPVEALAFSADNRFLAAATAGKTVKIWRLSDGKLASEIRLAENNNKISSIQFSPTAGSIAIAANQGWVGYFDASSGQGIASFETGLDISAMQFSPDGKQLALSAMSGKIAVYPAEPSEVLRIVNQTKLRPIRNMSEAEFVSYRLK